MKMNHAIVAMGLALSLLIVITINQQPSATASSKPSPAHQMMSEGSAPYPSQDVLDDKQTTNAITRAERERINSAMAAIEKKSKQTDDPEEFKKLKLQLQGLKSAAQKLGATDLADQADRQLADLEQDRMISAQRNK